MFKKFTDKRLQNYAFALLFLCFITLTTHTQAQVVTDNRSAGGAFSNTGVTTLSWTHTIGNGSNRALFVGVSFTNQAATAPVCSPSPCPPDSLPTTPLTGSLSSAIISVTSNGVAMQQDIQLTFVNNGVAIYKLVAPTPGENNIVVTFAPGVVTNASGNSVSFTGVNQTTPNINSNGTNDTSNTPSLLVSGANVTTDDIVFDALSSTPNAGFFVESAGQQVCTDASDEATCTRGRRFFFNAYDVGASSTETGNPAGILMSWTMSAAQSWNLAATVVKAAPPLTAAGATIGGRVVTPKGRGVARMILKLTESDGSVRTATTNSFGYFRFTDIAAGQNVTLEGFSKRHRIIPQTINVNENIADLNLTIEP